MTTSPKDEDHQFDDRLTDRPYSCVMNGRITTEDAIEKAEQYKALKQILLRLLDDPQVQQKLVSIFRIGSEQRPKQ